MATMTMTAMKTTTKRTVEENNVLCSSCSPMKCSGDPSLLLCFPKRQHPRAKRTPKSRPPKPPPRLPHRQSLSPTQLQPAATNFRIDLHALKTDIVMRVGADRSNCYFGHLNRFLAHKICKTEFLRLCISTLGRENIPLHNQLICSILHNAYRAKGPVPVDQCKPAEKSNANGNGVSETQKQVQKTSSNGAISRCNVRIEASPPRVNGVAVVPSSPPIPNEEDALACKTTFPSYLNTHAERARKPGSENGKAIAQHNDEEIGHQQTTKRARPEEDIADGESSAECMAIAFTMDHEQPEERAKIQDASVEVITVEDEEDNMDCTIDLNSLGIIQPPLGVPLCSASASMPRRMQQQAVSVARYRPSRRHGGTVKKRVQEIVKEQGLERVTEDCINVIHSGMEAYLKKLIRSSLELTGGIQTSKKPTGPSRGKHVVNYGDFKLAMELNPQQLGENWPLLLEKISFRSFVN